MIDDKDAQGRDDLRLEIAIQTIKDVLVRFEETSEGTRSVYEVVGFALTDLITNGLCPACLNEAVTMAYRETGADVDTHIDEAASTFH